MKADCGACSWQRQMWRWAGKASERKRDRNSHYGLSWEGKTYKIIEIALWGNANCKCLLGCQIHWRSLEEESRKRELGVLVNHTPVLGLLYCGQWRTVKRNPEQVALLLLGHCNKMLCSLIDQPFQQPHTDLHYVAFLPTCSCRTCAYLGNGTAPEGSIPCIAAHDSTVIFWTLGLMAGHILLLLLYFPPFSCPRSIFFCFGPILP